VLRARCGASGRPPPGRRPGRSRASGRCDRALSRRHCRRPLRTTRSEGRHCAVAPSEGPVPHAERVDARLARGLGTEHDPFEREPRELRPSAELCTHPGAQ
jgi:hypothetical protein